MIPPHRDPVTIEQGRAALSQMRFEARSLVNATLLTDDGFEIVSYPESDRDDGRLASMSSSIQALADAVARELQRGESEFVIISADRSHVIQRRVPGRPIVLAAVFAKEETLGQALSLTKIIVDKLSVVPRDDNT